MTLSQQKTTEELLKLALEDSVINLAIPKVLSAQDVLDGKIDTISVITFIGLLKYKTYDQSSSKRVCSSFLLLIIVSNIFLFFFFFFFSSFFFLIVTDEGVVFDHKRVRS